MLDNGAFSNSWQEATWRRRLEQLMEYSDTCLGAIVPDVICNAAATLARWKLYARRHLRRKTVAQWTWCLGRILIVCLLVGITSTGR
jgi:hypothetical protein